VPVRVYQYGLLPPLSHEKEVRDLLFTAHRYRNALTQIERERRAALREALGSGLHDAELAAAAIEEQLIATSREIKAHHAALRTRKTPDELAARHRNLKATHAEALGRFRVMKRALYESLSIKLALEEIQARFVEKKREARAASGLAPQAWGTYQRVEAAADQSRAMPLYDGILPNDPRFKRHTGEGSLAIHLQSENLMPIKSLFEPNNWVHVDPVDPRAWLPETARHDRRRLSRTKLHIRLGSSVGREPVFAEFPLIMHREIPGDAVISWAVVYLRRYGPREEWTVSFTVSLPEQKPAPAAARGEGAVAIDLGWRLLPSSRALRVCSYYGEDGRAGDLRLPGEVLQGLGEVPDGIRSVRDKNFDAARASLAEWLAMREPPEWLKIATVNLPVWRSPARLVKVAHLWSEARFSGDADAYEQLEAWRYRDRHLWQYESGQRRSGLRNRREIYRRFGAELAKRYDTVVFEDFDLSRLARRPKTTDTEKRENETARTNRFHAATGELRACILNAFASRGGSAEKVVSLDSTHICHACGSVEVFDAAAYITHLCSGCGAEWDQDENAARVLFERFRGDREKGSQTREIRLGQSESKWARIKREAAERRQGGPGSDPALRKRK
jgi:hypothetical protein